MPHHAQHVLLGIFYHLHKLASHVYLVALSALLLRNAINVSLAIYLLLVNVSPVIYSATIVYMPLICV